MTQHAGLSREHWQSFSLEQQVLMIGNEMNRAAKLTRSEDLPRLRRSYERVLQLTDLTIGVQSRRSFRREMLRWRDLVAELYLAGTASVEAHNELFRCLLQLTSASAQQIPFLLEERERRH